MRSVVLHLFPSPHQPPPPPISAPSHGFHLMLFPVHYPQTGCSYLGATLRSHFLMVDLSNYHISLTALITCCLTAAWTYITCCPSIPVSASVCLRLPPSASVCLRLPLSVCLSGRTMLWLPLLSLWGVLLMRQLSDILETRGRRHGAGDMGHGAARDMRHMGGDMGHALVNRV